MTFRQLLRCVLFGPLFLILFVGTICLSPFMAVFDLIVSKDPDPIDLVSDMLSMLIDTFREVYNGI